jgi:hypothetical protein
MAAKREISGDKNPAFQGDAVHLSGAALPSLAWKALDGADATHSMGVFWRKVLRSRRTRRRRVDDVKAQCNHVLRGGEALEGVVLALHVDIAKANSDDTRISDTVSSRVSSGNLIGHS